MRFPIVHTLSAAALSLCLSQYAEAVPMLRLQTSDGSSVTVADGGAGDANSVAGAVTFIGGLGNWVANVSTGISKPALGSADYPQLDLNSVNLSNLGDAGTVDILLTDTDFTAKLDLTTLIASIGGVTSGEISYRTFIDAANTPFAMTTELTGLGAFGGAFSATESTTYSSLTPYALTLLVSVSHDAGVQVSSFNATVKVPEPGSLLLFGAGLLAVGFARRPRVWGPGRRA